MLETLLGPLGAIFGKAAGRLAGQPHFKLLPSITSPEYGSRPGGYLALGLKIANVGKETGYFDRVEGILRDGSSRLLLVLELPYETPVHSNRSVVGFLPAKQLLEAEIVDLIVFDAVERSYRLGRGRFRTTREMLTKERTRLVAGGYSVDWQP